MHNVFIYIYLSNVSVRKALAWRRALRTARFQATDAVTRNALLAACRRGGWRQGLRLFEAELVACNALMAAVRWEAPWGGG